MLSNSKQLWGYCFSGALFIYESSLIGWFIGVKDSSFDNFVAMKKFYCPWVYSFELFVRRRGAITIGEEGS